MRLRPAKINIEVDVEKAKEVIGKAEAAIHILDEKLKKAAEAQKRLQDATKAAAAAAAKQGKSRSW